MNLLIENQLFPCVAFFKKATTSKHIKIEKYENFQKMSFRNRYIVSGANQLEELTVPVFGGREQKTIITEVKIDHNVNWAKKHWRGILSAYSNAPFFQYYSDQIKALLYSEEESLFTYNLNILYFFLKILKLPISVSFTTEFRNEYEDHEDFRNRLLPKNYLEQVNFLPTYPQVFEDRFGFQPNLSILDLLFCEGPNSRNFLS